MVRSNLAKAITNKSGYEAYDRADIDNLMKEHNFQATGLVSDEQIKELGVMTGAQFVLIEEAALVDAKHIYVTAKILNVETAQLHITDNELMAADPQSIQKGCQKLANRLLSISGKANATSHSSSGYKDIDKAQSFKTVQIGNQVWMAENLNVAVDRSSCYNDNPSNCTRYGRLYTWESAKKAAEMIPGWHLPTDEEWTVLTNYLGSNAGTRLKSGGDSGFEALLAGYRFSADHFLNLGDSGYFWSSSPNGSSGAWGRSVYRTGSGVYRSRSSRGSRFSVRLLKD